MIAARSGLLPCYGRRDAALAFSASLVSHVGTVSGDQFEIRIVINNRLRLQLVVGQRVQGGLLLSLGVEDDQHRSSTS